MRPPDGDQDGCTPSPSTSFRGAPPLTLTTYSVLTPSRCDGSPISSVPYAICLPSGDHAGSNPDSVTRRTDSPVAPAMKMPPVGSEMWNAICEPSGEKDAPLSSRC